MNQEKKENSISMDQLLSEKLIRFEEMASGLSHELNNPLAIIIGKLDIIEMKLKKKNLLSELQLESQFESVRKMAFRIKKVVDSLRYMSEKNSQSEFKIVSLKEILDPVFDMTGGHFIHSGIHFKLLKDIPDLNIKGRPSELSQILLALLLNSIQALESSFEKWIHMNFEADLDFVKIYVIDAGHGLTEQVQQKLFTPFFTTKGPDQGTGISLCLAKKSIENQKGSIQYQKLNGHTCFVLNIPLAPLDSK